MKLPWVRRRWYEFWLKVEAERYEKLAVRTRELDATLRMVGRRDSAMRILDTSPLLDVDKRNGGNSLYPTVGDAMRALVDVQVPPFVSRWGRDYARERDAGGTEEQPSQLRPVGTMFRQVDGTMFRPVEVTVHRALREQLERGEREPLVAARPGDDDPVMQAAWDRLNESGFVVAP